ncbi:MAG: DNA polymerase I [Clostridium sp.]
MNKERLVILDGNSLLYRAYFAMQLLTNSEGLHTNALYGFTNMLIKIKEDYKPDYIVVAFDKKGPTFRHNQYSEYKAGRKKMPWELAEQFPIAKDILSKFSISIFEKDGYEGDDLIGTLSVFADKKDIETFVITGDRDALQLATDNVKVVITKKGLTEVEVYDKEKFEEEFAITPKEFIDVKGLMGDSSDNIPGVPGIGEKTAFKLIVEYKSIENLLDNIDKLSGKKLKENLIEYKEQAILSKKLSTIILDVPIEVVWEDIKSQKELDFQGLKDIFSRLQFKNILSKLPELCGCNREEEKEDSVIYGESISEVKFEEIKELNSLDEFVKNLSEEVYLIADIVDPTITSKTSIDKLYINNKENNYIVNLKDIIDENKKEAVEILKRIFNTLGLKIISHNTKHIYTSLINLGIKPIDMSFDVEIAAYLVDPGKRGYSLKTLIEGILHRNIDESTLENKINEVKSLKELHKYYSDKIEEMNMMELMYKVEMPLTRVISVMEKQGIKVNSQKLDELSIKFGSEIIEIEKEIHELCGEEFNIKSPKQLGKILFEKLDLPVTKKTKTGYSTDIEVLEKLSDMHPAIKKIINYRQLTKIYSTYIEGLRAVIDSDGKIHSSFNQTVTTTGRLSSTEPNLQNIPIKYEMGREIRKVFIPDDDNCVLLSADYSQIELRVLAHIAGDDNMIQAFKEHSDIHRKTASEVFGVPIEEVTQLMRSNAKAVNFGIVYGIGDFSLAKDLGISKNEAKEYIDTYLQRYPKISEYLEKVKKEAKETQKVTTILNRVRFIPEIVSSRKMVVAFGERLAMNTPIQGSAADIIKVAMVNVAKKLEENNLESTLILQVHDELILNVYKSEVDEVKSIVKKEMEEVRKLKVPLEIDMSVGNNWYEAK